MLQVQEAKVVAPQQFEPQPVRALVRAALGLTTIVGIVVVSIGALLGALPPAALARLRGAGPRG